MKCAWLVALASAASGFVAPCTMLTTRRPVVAVRAEAEESTSTTTVAEESATTEEPESPPESPPPAAASKGTKPGQYDVRKLVKSDEGPGFNQFDPVLTATQFVSRRFGIVGGLAIFLGLAAIEGKEILASFTESGPEAGSGQVVTAAGGLKYKDVLVGTSGSVPLPGYVVGLEAKVRIGDKVIYDTKDDKPIAFKYGARPFQNVLCEGVERGIAGMKVGGKRTIIVPKALAPPGVDLPDGFDLVYDVQLTEVLSGYF